MANEIPDEAVKRFVCFYLVEGFWAGAKPDFAKFGSQYYRSEEFSALMDEAVVTVRSGTNEVVVYRDGLVAYGDDGLLTADRSAGLPFDRVAKYSERLNALSAILVSEITRQSGIRYHTHFEITHHDIIPLTFWKSGSWGMGVPLKSVARSQLEKRHLSSYPDPDHIDWQMSHPPRPIVPQSTIESVATDFLAHVDDANVMRLLSRANKAAAEYENTAFSDCILVCWFEAEAHLYDLIRDHMSREGATRFNRERREFLTKDARISEVIEVLEVAGSFDMTRYRALGAVRKVRNKIVHEGYDADMADASAALELLHAIILETTKKDVLLSTGISISGF